MTSNGFLSFSALVVIAIPVWGYKIRPTDVSAKTLKPRHHVWIRGISPVHEKLTKNAFTCATMNPTGSFPCTQEELFWDGSDGEHPLIRGSRWNDDPNNLFEGKHPVEWVFWLTDGAKKAKEGKLERINFLTYRSHFFDLQFLHAMAMKGQPAMHVRQDILDWCRFAYDVAVGTVNPNATILSLREEYAFARKFDGTGPLFWTVKKLFTNIGEKKYKKVLQNVSDQELRLRVTGALLHTIQDSYSRSHVERESTEVPARPPSGPIKAFLDYSDQNHSCHGDADVEPDWVDLDSGLNDGPVLHGAWLIRRVLARKPWDEEATIRFADQVFPLSSQARKADGGTCATRR